MSRKIELEQKKMINTVLDRVLEAIFKQND